MLDFLQGEHIADSLGRRGDERSDELEGVIALSGSELRMTSRAICVVGAL